MLTQIWQSFLHVCDPNITSDILDQTIIGLVVWIILLSLIAFIAVWKSNKTVQYRR